MSDRPTPETDEAQFGTGRVSVDFARRLERERDEARDQLNRICRDGFRYQDTIGLEPCADYALRKLNEERDLARELRDALTGMEEYYRQHNIRGSLFVQVHEAITKAKEVIP